MTLSDTRKIEILEGALRILERDGWTRGELLSSTGGKCMIGAVMASVSEENGWDFPTMVKETLAPTGIQVWGSPIPGPSVWNAEYQQSLIVAAQVADAMGFAGVANVTQWNDGLAFDADMVKTRIQGSIDVLKSKVDTAKTIES